MGVIGRILGAPAAATAIGEAATSVAEVFTPNATKRMEAGQAAYLAALDAFGTEFQSAGPGAFDRFVNGLNRLPRPLLALGTIGLFVHAMVDPEGFARRMTGLSTVPEPLWWLFAAIVGFYFGAREAHYLRNRPASAPQSHAARHVAPTARDANPALDEWRRGR
ncbi:holin family protein [Defluviimonas sp. WL0024]|uniref:Holin family protein n=1 Tax=Albidovulum salinarum TaxID=2984153 RepID=A0ABT2X7G7_9RHOB|nr:holin family protein [Defluviimonas sp. WL0024]MCU9849679.1 holin family protein [Defluviimonas sp. WL0024]